jgi:murein DD-endopeptidase MepM/ murein hydrolase activator NlpD
VLGIEVKLMLGNNSVMSRFLVCTSGRRDLRIAVAALLISQALGGCGWVEISGTNQPWAVNRSAGSVPFPQSKADPIARDGISAGTIIAARGDTVYDLARRHGVPMRTLIEANGLRPPYWLKIGQRIILPLARQHVVQRGESIYAIARNYGVASSSLANANGLTNNFTLYPGQTLRIPGQGRAIGPSTAERSSGPSVALASKKLRPPAALPRAPAPIPKPAARSGSFIWPVSGKLLSGFGVKGNGLHNDGINIAVARGTPVRAAENGVVAYAGNEIRGFGNMLLIKHTGGWVSAYAHNAEILVKRGTRVKKGDIIAKVGSSGSVDSPQLHFELRRGKEAVDPTKYLKRGSA